MYPFNKTLSVPQNSSLPLCECNDVGVHVRVCESMCLCLNVTQCAWFIFVCVCV